MVLFTQQISQSLVELVEHEEYREMALIFDRFRVIYVLPKRTSGCTKTEENERGNELC